MDSIASLIDKLTVTNIKIYHLVDIIQDEDKNDTEVANAARKAQSLNSYRSQLMNEINEALQENERVIKL